MTTASGDYDFSKIVEGLKAHGFDPKELVTERQLRTALRDLEERGRDMIHCSNQLAIELRLIETRTDSAARESKAQTQGDKPKPLSTPALVKKSKSEHSEVRAGLVTQGTSTLKYHALRPDDTAACSSHLPVEPAGPASKIESNHRCRSRACAKLFKEADLKAISMDSCKK